jgi:iron complex outermembrane receptor protein
MNRLGLRPHALRAAYIASASLLSIVTATPAFAAQPAADQPAQPAADQPAQPGTPDIVVTAQFREQRLQDTPLAITAIPAELLEQRSQRNLVEITSQAPNVTLRQQGASFGPSIGASIRGVGQFDFSPAFEPGVGIYIDDVYYSALTGANFDLLDLERVEILRGPQGTLEGRNSVGGSIRMITRRPDADGGGFVEATYGSRNLVAFRGGATFTVADGLYARISGSARQQTGFVDHIDYGCSHPGSGVASQRGTSDCLIDHFGGVGYAAIRGALRYHPHPGIDIQLAGDFTRDSRTNAAEVLVAAQPPGNTLNIGPAFGPRFICGRYCNYAQFNQPAITWAGPVAPGIPLVATTGTNNTRFEGWGLALNADFNLADSVRVQSITAYREWNNRFDTDDDLSPSNVGFGQNALDYWFWSQELRVNIDVASNFQLTLGGYYNDQRTEYFTYQDIRYAVIPLQFVYAPGHDPVNADSWALFTTAIWHPMENFTLTGGLRYSDEHKDYTFNRQNPDGSPNPFLGALAGVVASADADRVDYRLSADYRFSPEALAYATFSTGFKGGGVGPRPFNPAQARGFGPETLNNYELGLKLDLFNRMVRFNTAAFYNEYNGIQLVLLSCPQFGGPGPCALPQNAGDAHIKGLEFETFIHPTTGLTIDGSLSWIGFKYQCVNITVVRALAPGETDVCSSDPSIIGGLSSRPPATPEWKWSFGIQYEIPTGIGSITPRFDVTHQSGTSGGLVAGGFDLPGFTVANARVTWRDNSNNWQAALEVTNLFEEYYYLTTFDLRGAGAGFVKAQPGRPREFALTITRRF